MFSGPAVSTPRGLFLVVALRRWLCLLVSSVSANTDALDCCNFFGRASSATRAVTVMLSAMEEKTNIYAYMFVYHRIISNILNMSPLSKHISMVVQLYKLSSSHIKLHQHLFNFM